MQDRYDSRGRLLDEPDDPEYIWICSGCDAEEWTLGPLPPGWEMIRTGLDGDEWAISCDRCLND